jgi:hypothetical protein
MRVVYLISFGDDDCVNFGEVINEKWKERTKEER